MAGIGVILNPHSRSNRKNPGRVKRLSFIVGDKGSCHATYDTLDVPKALSEFKEKKIEILGISGGDGTLHYTLTEMLKVYGNEPLPKIAFLRGGTMNNAAQSLGIYGSPEKILSNLICKYHSGDEFKMSHVHLLNVNGMYGFLFGVGVVSKVVEVYYKDPEESSPYLAFKIALKVIGACIFNTEWANKLCEKIDAQVLIDGKEWSLKNYTAITSGTVATFGFGFNPFYRTRKEVGKYQIVGVSMKPRTLLLRAFNAFLSRPFGGKEYLDDLASHVEILCKEPQIYTVDGELFGPVDKITVSTGPRLDVIVG